MPALLIVGFSVETGNFLLGSQCILNDCSPEDWIPSWEFTYIYSFPFFKNQAKEWTPAGKAKKENPAKKFYSESEEEEDSSDSSSDSGGVYNLLKTFVPYSLYALPPTKHKA